MDAVPPHRACALCRSHKVRCIPDPSNPDGCQRCLRSGRRCAFTPLQKRRPRKRTDTRVAELEQEMRAVRSMLKRHDDETTTGPGLRAQGFAHAPTHVAQDVVDRGVLSMATARRLFEAYKTELYPHYPVVYIAPSCTADQLRHAKPALFLSVVAAASGKEDAELSAALDQEVLQAYAARSLVQSQKSLELVQALLISAVWYHPPCQFAQLKYYEYIQMAAAMAMDIGIGSRPSAQRARATKSEDERLLASHRPPPVHPAEDFDNPDLSMAPRTPGMRQDTASIEARRSFLACYIICAAVSLSLRRPNMLRVTSHIRECVSDLEQSPDAVAHDANLVAWARLIMIAEEISTSFCHDDPGGGVASLADRRTQMMLKDFASRLDRWHANTPPAHNAGTGSLTIMYYTVRLYCFELALHVDHSPEDFRAPCQMGGIHPIENADDIPTRVLADSVTECVSSAHALLQTFLSMEVECARALPVFSYVRVSFAAFVLAKLSLSAAHPRSRMGRVIDRRSLEVDRYMDRAILHVRDILGVNQCRVPSIFLALLFKLRRWCRNPTLLIDEPDEVDHDSRRIYTDEARITDHLSSNQNSPPTAADAAVAFPASHVLPIASGGSSRGAQGASGTVHVRGKNPRRSNSQTSEGASDVEIDGTAPAAAPSMPASTAGPAARTDQVTDENGFPFLGEMGFAGGGGLTGVDDWATLPPDLFTISPLETMDWQFLHASSHGGAGM